jgi:hypothetical protein
VARAAAGDARRAACGRRWRAPSSPTWACARCSG